MTDSLFIKDLEIFQICSLIYIANSLISNVKHKRFNFKYNSYIYSNPMLHQYFSLLVRSIWWFRKLKLFDYFLDYFPMKLVKTAELRPDRNYVVASFPHGVMW